MTHEICPAQCLAYTTSLNRLTHFFQALEFEFYGCSHSTLVSKRPSLVSFSPLDYNCLKDQGSFSCIFVIPAHSTLPGAEMLHAHLLRWGIVLLVRLVDTHTVLFRPEFLTPILTALACYSNDFATLHTALEPATALSGAHAQCSRKTARQIHQFQPSPTKEWSFG